VLDIGAGPHAEALLFEGLFRGSHLLIIFIIVLLIFGPSKLPGLGSALGKTIRDFKKAVGEPDGPAADQAHERKLESAARTDAQEKP
jgi:sec-independent protein translocase protein TatA